MYAIGAQDTNTWEYLVDVVFRFEVYLDFLSWVCSRSSVFLENKFRLENVTDNLVGHNW